MSSAIMSTRQPHWYNLEELDESVELSKRNCYNFYIIIGHFFTLPTNNLDKLQLLILVSLIGYMLNIKLGETILDTTLNI